MTDTRRRVKVYTLNEDRQWDDRGTGHVSSGYVERFKATSLLVRAESDGSLLLESKINPNTAYQKQQDTLIVWSEAENYDLALSFQEKAGCDEIWEKICQVQGKDPSVDITQDVVDESEEERFDDMSSPGLELPPCELNRLEDLAELVASSLPSPLRREKLALAVENEGYIRKLLELFRVCEDLENREGLHHLYEIIKGIFLLNRTALFEVMFSEECIMDVIGCLEFDPALSQPRRHREFLTKTARFKEVIPISDPELRQKIHQTYRVQYIQDMVLPTPSVFEENMLSTLHSFIFFNKVEIVGMLQDDEKFLTDLFAQLTDEATDDDKRHELVNFLKEFCAFSQTLQPQNRDAFFKTLSNMGILPALEVILGMDDVQVRGAATDIFSYLVEYNPSMVREFVMQESQQNDDDILLINLIIEHMICDTDPELGGAVQLMGLLRTLVDPENMLATANKTEKTEFLSFFYKHCMHVLSAPLLANTTEEKPSKDDFQTSQLLALILELLTFCVEHHTYHIKNYIINKDILRRVLVLTASQHAFLALCALRFMRRIIGLKDEFYNRYIMRNFLFEPVIKAFLNNGSRYNLMNSAIIEMFECVRSEDVKSLTAHIVENYWKALEDVDYVQTFKGLKLRYEQQRERQDNPKLDSMRSILRNHRFRRDARTLEDEEEMWFNTDEDDLEDGEAVVPPSDKMKTEEDLMEPISKFMERKKLKDTDDKEVLGKSSLSGRQNPSFKLSFSGSTKTSLSSPPSSASLNPGSPGSPGSGARSSSSTTAVTTKGGLVGLVDYPDDDDEDEDEEEEDGESKEDPLPPSKKSKLSS
ncbi:serine/threonine-protein phosphatase 4 regulatory subunit 3 isoform X5 [Centropristis striata]|uniref:serine/threonine-protein phosphatase 4 regulatory subunit 3 isoform X5 n=1 Tax=Centropristis striata TaxID=184440 RepID=UPI0027E0683C|nr:serine/threonine-protein phosphatase 4 regulatory subunit 3 isoform X5 [Centropristis striata]